MSNTEKEKVLTSIFFSPTKSTEKIVCRIGKTLSEDLKLKYKEINLTFPEARKESHIFDEKDIVLMGFPVYEGRVPKVLLKTLEQMKATNTPVIVIAVYGNREYDDSLLECADALSQSGFCVIAAGAFIAEHSIIKQFGTGRPDQSDLQHIDNFSINVVQKIKDGNLTKPDIKGNRPYRVLAAPSRAIPQTNENCNMCKGCVNVCPMQAIDEKNPTIISDECICCHACVKACPQGAKYFDNKKLKEKLEFVIKTFGDRKEPEIFI